MNKVNILKKNLVLFEKWFKCIWKDWISSVCGYDYQRIKV